MRASLDARGRRLAAMRGVPFGTSLQSRKEASRTSFDEARQTDWSIPHTRAAPRTGLRGRGPRSGAATDSSRRGRGAANCRGPEIGWARSWFSRGGARPRPPHPSRGPGPEEAGGSLIHIQSMSAVLPKRAILSHREMSPPFLPRLRKSCSSTARSAAYTGAPRPTLWSLRPLAPRGRPAACSRPSRSRGSRTGCDLSGRVAGRPIRESRDGRGRPGPEVVTLDGGSLNWELRGATLFSWPVAGLCRFHPHAVEMPADPSAVRDPGSPRSSSARGAGRLPSRVRAASSEEKACRSSHPSS